MTDWQAVENDRLVDILYTSSKSMGGEQADMVFTAADRIAKLEFMLQTYEKKLRDLLKLMTGA